MSDAVSEDPELVALDAMLLDALRYRFLREGAQALALQMDGTAHWHIPSALLACFRGRTFDDVVDQARRASGSV